MRARFTARPLLHRNPFRSVGVTQKASKIYVGPMRREGITSLEKAEKARTMKHLSQLSNAGMVKQMRELGIIPDDMGVDMSQFSDGLSTLPSGVANLEDVEKQADVAHQAEMYNAGILDQEHREQKTLMELARKRKMSEYRKKIIQWLAETDELDQVPAEFAEEVEEYYASNPNGKNGKDLKEAVAQARKERKEKEEEKESKQLMRRGFWMPSNRAFNTLQHNTYDSTRNTDYGLGIINAGWRAPRLHRLVRPLKRFEIEEGPDKIIEDQKQALDDRRSMYTDEQTHQRGTAPPKDMVERAMPKLVEPFFARQPIPQYYTRPDYNITPHPFVFPSKKYSVRAGLW